MKWKWDNVWKYNPIWKMVFLPLYKNIIRMGVYNWSNSYLIIYCFQLFTHFICSLKNYIWKKIFKWIFVDLKTTFLFKWQVWELMQSLQLLFFYILRGYYFWNIVLYGIRDFMWKSLESSFIILMYILYSINLNIYEYK